MRDTGPEVLPGMTFKKRNTRASSANACGFLAKGQQQVEGLRLRKGQSVFENAGNKIVNIIHKWNISGP